MTAYKLKTDLQGVREFREMRQEHARKQGGNDKTSGRGRQQAIPVEIRADIVGTDIGPHSLMRVRLTGEAFEDITLENVYHITGADISATTEDPVRALAIPVSGLGYVLQLSSGGDGCCGFAAEPDLTMLDGTESFNKWTLTLERDEVYRTTDENGKCTLPAGEYILAYTPTDANGGEGWTLDISSDITVERISDGADVTGTSSPTGKIWLNPNDDDEWAEAQIEMDATVT